MQTRMPCWRLPVEVSEMAQIAQQLRAGHPAVSDRVEETVAHRLVLVLVVDDAEAVAEEDLLGQPGAACIFGGLADEVERAVGRRAEHGGQGVLGRVARARRGGVEEDQHEGVAQPSDVVAFAQGRVFAAEERVGDGCDGDALPGVAEDLRSGDHQDPVLRIAGHGSLVGGLEGAAERLAEVHAEVGVVACGQFADRAQLVLRQADPRRIVGVRVDDGRHVARRQVAFDLRTEFLGAVVVDVERLARDAQNAHLTALYGEARVDEEDLALRGVELRAEQEGVVASLHRADGRDASLRGDLDVEESPKEARCRLLELRDAEHVGILRGYAGTQGGAFGLDAHPFGRESRDAHLQVEEFGLRVALHHAGDVARLADRRLCDVRDVHPLECRAEDAPVEGYVHRSACFRAAS